MPVRAFGLSLDFASLPPGAWRNGVADRPDVTVRRTSIKEVEQRWSGGGELGWEAEIDGAEFVVERGSAGDHLFRHGADFAGLLSPSGSELICGIDEHSDPLGWRVILDSVLFSVALLAGLEALHAGAVATSSGAVAITAGAGGGKSTLLAEFLADGAELISDDVVVIEAEENAPPRAHPGPPLVTVPDAVPAPPGELIAPVDGERWMAVPTVSEPRPLAGMVVLDRRPGSATVIEDVDAPLSILMASLLHFPRDRARERSRFEMAAAIAAHVPVWRLRADPEVPPAALARLLKAGLDE